MIKFILPFFCAFFISNNFLFSQSKKDCDTSPELIIEKPEGATPWSSLDLNNNPCQFQFAIVTDRTGGHRPGIFLDGIKKLNLLQPEFVMSVGDLIEGYTEDLTELNRQWEEFDGFIEQLEMPFFYLPGNHDITNKVMEDLWKERFGHTYYYFIYKDVLFLCLNSEDQYRGSSKGSISDEQYEWIKMVLAKHTEVKWTLVFMHQPLWVQSVDPVHWNDVESLLSSRKHTVFVGHRHYYAKYERNNSNYFLLATTGGSSALRGPQFGEFDHVVWVTMTKDGPLLANLQLEGIWDENVSTQATREFIRETSAQMPIQAEPYYLKGKKFKSGTVRLKLSNDRDVPMQVKLQKGFSWDLKTSLSSNKIEVAPNSVEFVDLLLEPKTKKNYSDLDAIKIKATVAYLAEDLPKIDVPFTFNIGTEPRYELPKAPNNIKIDGLLDEWKELPYLVESDNKMDISAEFAVSYDDQYLYLAAAVTDDDLQLDTTTVAWQQDFIGVVVNADPIAKSVMDKGTGWYLNSILYTVTPETQTLSSSTDYGDRYPADFFKWKCIARSGGYDLEIAIPLAYIKERQGENWQTARINIILQDQDAGELEKPRYRFKPDWRGSEHRVGSGMFFRK